MPNVEFLQPYPAVAEVQLGIGTVTKPVARYFIDWASMAHQQLY
jgi:hypothetical protein